MILGAQKWSYPPMILSINEGYQILKSSELAISVIFYAGYNVMSFLSQFSKGPQVHVIMITTNDLLQTGILMNEET